MCCEFGFIHGFFFQLLRSHCFSTKSGFIADQLSNLHCCQPMRARESIRWNMKKRFLLLLRLLFTVCTHRARITTTTHIIYSESKIWYTTTCANGTKRPCCDTEPHIYIQMAKWKMSCVECCAAVLKTEFSATRTNAKSQQNVYRIPKRLCI